MTSTSSDPTHAPDRPRRLVLRFAGGTRAGRKVVLDPGQTLRVGRDETADLSIDDATMALFHCDIDWDGERSRVRRVDGETRLGGRPIETAYAAHGDFVQAGATAMTLHREGHTPPRRAPDSRRAAPREVLAELTDLVARSSLWAVIDAARDPRIVEVLNESVEEARSLYEGAPALDDVAPRLVRFRAGSHLLGTLVDEGWGLAWGIFIVADLPEKEMRRHLRRFLMVEAEDTRKRMYFRFYDPGVLRTFLPTCSARQLGELFGELEAFACESDADQAGNRRLLRFAATDIDALATDDL